jgi:hypothetical protein
MAEWSMAVVLKRHVCLFSPPYFVRAALIGAPRLAMADNDAPKISDRLVQVVFALVLAQSLFLFRGVVVHPFVDVNPPINSSNLNQAPAKY